MTSPDVEAIVKRLTKAQREAVLKAITTRGVAHGLLRTGLVRTTQAADGVGTLITLSAAGQQVRAHILSQEQNP